MEIRYDDRKLERLCKDQREAVKRLGSPCARKLRARMADIESASSPLELLVGNPHPLKRDRYGQYSVTLHGGVRLCFCPDHEPIPTHDDAGIDWSKVSKVIVLYIGDYHD